MAAPKRNHNAVKTHCKRGHPFDQLNTYVRPGNGSRVCRICHQKSSREAQARRRERDRPGYNRRERERRRSPILKRPRSSYEYRMQEAGFPRRLLETLWLEGGWWTDEGLALRLGVEADHVSRTFYRLHRAGLLESRKVGLAYGVNNNMSMQYRMEWKALNEPAQMVLAFDD